MPDELTPKERILRYCSPEKEIPFTVEEYRDRLKRLREAMASTEIEMLYLSSPESLYYISGYKAEWYQAQSPRNFMPVSGLAVHVDHEDFILFDYEEEEVLCRYTTVSNDTRIFKDVDQSQMMNWIVQELRKESWIPSTVGLEMWSYRPNRAVSELFQRELERFGCVVVDGSNLVKELRSVKSPKEIEYSEMAGKIADIGMRTAIEYMRPGMTELEVYGEIINSMAKAGGENPAITLPVVSGPKSACIHGLSSKKRIDKGEIVNIDISGVYNRYHANTARTFSMGKPDEEVARIVKLSAGVFDEISQSIRPDIPVAELNRNIDAYYKRVGLGEEYMWWGGGYELGIAFPPDWVGSFVYDPSFDSGDKAFIPGTVVNFESNFYLPKDAGLSAIINTLVFKESEAKILSEVPNDLVIIE